MTISIIEDKLRYNKEFINHKIMCLMKRIWILSLLTALLFSSCDGQTGKKTEERKLTSPEPKTNVVVNKEYDENGNLTRYDSTYTYYYSNIENDSVLEDSIFRKFTQEFNTTFPFSNEAYFNDLFFQDSLLKYDFYKEDFFRERFKRNMEMMDQLFNEMDQMKNEFFMKQIPPETKKDEK